MQRVCRDAPPGLPIAEHQPAIDLLHGLLPPHESRLFALPRAGADGLREWWTTQEGQPQPYSGLDEKSQATLLEKYQGTLSDLLKLGDTLRQQGRTGEADLLENLPRTPDTRHLYSLNGTPLITHWHAGLSGLAPAVAPLAVPADTTALTTTGPTRRWLWLLALLALLALLLAAWWWWTHRTPPVSEPISPPVATPVAPPPPEPAASATPEPVVPPVSEPVPQPPAPTKSAAGLTCAPRPADQSPPELVIVFDTSNSMDLNIATSPEDEDWIFSLTAQQRSRLSAPEKARFLAMLRRPTREEVAKKSLIDLVEQLPTSQSISMVTFNSCTAPTTIRHGPFPGTQHARITQLIQRLKINGGTPLADSIEAAAAMVDGKNRDAIIVVFLDGEDGCGEDQCATAARIAKAQPRLKFNVVDISGQGLSNCIAKSTGGRVYSTRDAARIAEALSQSVREVSEDVICK
ncbi:hypothetical protein CDEN61S_00880 [Castellaniella denitrificans]